MIKKILSKLNFFKKMPKIVKVLAFLIPIAILLIVLYVNFLPFGYSDHQIINVGSENDTFGRFYLEESSSLGTRQEIDGKYFRFLDGITHVVYTPRVVLDDAKIRVSLEGENVSFFTQPDLNIDWDYEWDINNINDFDSTNLNPETIYPQFLNGRETSRPDFSKPFALLFNWQASLSEELAIGDISLIQDLINITLKFNETEIKYPIPDYFIGKEQTALVGFNGKDIYFFVNEELIDKKKTSESFSKITLKKGKVLQYKEGTEIKETLPEKDGCMYFDGETRLVFPDSKDMFGEGPFAVYVEWIPERKESGQQLIGHFNWEVRQNYDSVSFTIGRTNLDSFHSVSHKIDNDFFNKKHSLVVTYSPSLEEEKDGYISLFLDNFSVREKNIENEFIKKDYSQNLSMGWTPHNYNKSPYFKGLICNAKFAYKELKPEYKDTLDFLSSEKEIKIPIVGTGKLEKIELKVMK